MPEPIACAKCGKPFEWQDGEAGTSARLDAMYCTRKCANAAAQQRWRQRQAS